MYPAAAVGIAKVKVQIDHDVIIPAGHVVMRPVRGGLPWVALKAAPPIKWTVVGVTIDAVQRETSTDTEMLISVQTRGTINAVVQIDSKHAQLPAGQMVRLVPYRYTLPDIELFACVCGISDGPECGKLGTVHSHFPGSRYAVVRLATANEGSDVTVVQPLALYETAAGFVDAPTPAAILTNALVALSAHTHNNHAESGLAVVSAGGPTLSAATAGVTVEGNAVHVTVGSAAEAFFEPPPKRRRTSVSQPPVHPISGSGKKRNNPFANTTINPTGVEAYQKFVREALVKRARCSAEDFGVGLNAALGSI